MIHPEIQLDSCTTYLDVEDFKEYWVFDTTEVGVGSESRAGSNGSELDRSKVDGGKVGDDEIEKKVQNLSKSKKTVQSDFLTPKAKLAFAKLRQAFVKAPILHHFDLERHIRIETDASGYAIGGVLS